MEQGYEDERDYIDDLIDQLPPEGRHLVVVVLEEQLRVLGRPYKVRESVPSQPPAVAAPSETRRCPGDEDPPDFWRFKVPAGHEYDGLAKAGDVLVLRKVRWGYSQRDREIVAADRRWHVLFRAEWLIQEWSQGEHLRFQLGLDILKAEPPWRVFCPARIGYRRAYGWGYEPDGMARQYPKGIDMAMFRQYEVLEVQPGSDRDWRADPEFLAAVRALKA